MKTIILLLSLFSAAGACQNQKPFPDDDDIDKSNYEYIDEWQKGYLDIHQISTGRGNSSFIIMPDGTTFMVDVGDMGAREEIVQDVIMPERPSPAKRPAEWIARYIKHFGAPLGRNGDLDYVLITHFDSDHVGKDGRLAISVTGKEYKLTGVTQLAQLVDIATLIDRGYPDYNYPTRDKLLSHNAATFPNYYKYVEERDAQQRTTQMFEAGSNTQIKMLKDAVSYPTFEIRNIHVNGSIWTGSGNNTREIFPVVESIPANQYENRCSAAFTMSYGKFNYFSGGDVLGVVTNSQSGFDQETAIGNLIGETDVVLCNHHAYSDAMNSNFIAATRPQAFIIPVWDYYHPQPDPLSRMLSQSLYSGEREIFSAGMVESNRIRLGENGQKIRDGHIVVRVYEGGEEFQIFVLNDASEDYEIVYKTERMISK